MERLKKEQLIERIYEKFVNPHMYIGKKLDTEKISFIDFMNILKKEEIKDFEKIEYINIVLPLFREYVVAPYSILKLNLFFKDFHITLVTEGNLITPYKSTISILYRNNEKNKEKFFEQFFKILNELFRITWAYCKSEI